MNLSHSEAQVMKSIHQNSGISRKALADVTGLSQASITNITKILIEQQYIYEGEHISRGPGRKEVLLYANPLKFRFLGIDIGGYRLRLAISDSNLRIEHEKEHSIEQFAEDADPLPVILDLIDQFLAEASVDAGTIDAIGVGVTGIVDAKLKTILNVPNVPRWGAFDIVDALHARYRCPAFLDESGRAMALAEKRVGQAKSFADFITVHIGYGIVSGIMINEQIVRGYNNVGGLLGHITADENAGRCMCGNYGCLENLVTFPIIRSLYKKSGGGERSIEDAYDHNDKVALDVCVSSGKAIGIALSNVINLFNPQAVLIGGPVFDKLPLIFEETKRTILLRANRFATVHLQLSKSSFGSKQGMMGALALASSSFLT